MILRACSTLSARYCRADFNLKLISQWRPILSSLVFDIKHRGHGHNPLSRIVAKSTLGNVRAGCFTKPKILPNSLFGIVCGIGEYPWINSPLDPIITCDDNAVCHRVNKVVIQDILPDRLHEFTSTMGQKLVSLGIPVWVPTCDPTFE
jgi:hypothetical protein